MRQYQCRLYSLICLMILGLGGCASMPYDYRDYRNHMPRSVLVIPPLNNSIEVDASYVYLSTITRPLAEVGYYVFPVAVVDAFMKENGLPMPAEMNGVPLNKIGEIFGADALLYITIEKWGQKYYVISSNTVVKARARLVDVKTGGTLWEGTAQASEGSGNGGGGLIGMVIAAAVEQVLDTSAGRVQAVSAIANHRMILSTDNGLLLGPYNPEYATDARGR